MSRRSRAARTSGSGCTAPLDRPVPAAGPQLPRRDLDEQRGRRGRPPVPERGGETQYGPPVRDDPQPRDLPRDRLASNQAVTTAYIVSGREHIAPLILLGAALAIVSLLLVFIFPSLSGRFVGPILLFVVGIAQSGIAITFPSTLFGHWKGNGYRERLEWEAFGNFLSTWPCSGNTRRPISRCGANGWSTARPSGSATRWRGPCATERPLPQEMAMPVNLNRAFVPPDPLRASRPERWRRVRRWGVRWRWFRWWRRLRRRCGRPLTPPPPTFPSHIANRHHPPFVVFLLGPGSRENAHRQTLARTDPVPHLY